MSRRILGILGLAATVALAACSDDPQGPGTITLTVDAAAPLGAAVLDLRGGGIEGVEEPAAGWAVLRPLATSGHRLLVVAEQAGDLVVRIRVADLDAPLPRATLLQASGQDDRAIEVLGGIDVRVRR